MKVALCLTCATGSIGGPKWGVDAKVRPEPGLLALRKTLGVYANIRPASFASDSLLELSPLKEDRTSDGSRSCILEREMVYKPHRTST